MTDDVTQEEIDKAYKDMTNEKEQKQELITPEQMLEFEKLKDLNESGNMKLMIKSTLSIFIKNKDLLDQINAMIDMFYPEIERMLKSQEQESQELYNRLNRIEQNMKIVNENLSLIYGYITDDPAIMRKINKHKKTKKVKK